MKKRPIIITTTNAITIPKKVRNLLDLQPGDCLDYEVMANGSIILVRKECCDSPSLRPICKLPCQSQKRK
ncbi:MAG: AbrB/MazE/SpoVT family DNA-binding domain-containing protein [Chloroflexi bacterium]|nr:AbrB/MazE/SpoVT family DNA-binding domain-containing protein [Chloroflexota bacterium]